MIFVDIIIGNICKYRVVELIIKSSSRYQDEQKYIISSEAVFVTVMLKSNACAQEIAFVVITQPLF